MKNILTLFALSMLFMASCSKLPDIHGGGDDADPSVFHDEIVLGNRLDNPYSLDNMKSAFETLYPTKSASDLEFTDYYVRFLPTSPQQLDELRAMGLSLIDHPMDYEILREGDWYHDPSLAEEDITWQYAVVPRGFVFPSGVRCELIQQCFLTENSPATKAMEDIDWDAVEHQAYVISGNGDMWDQIFDATKSDVEMQPEGRIMLVDSELNGGQPEGLAGVKVECNVFVKYSSAYTDRDGYYRIPKKFSTSPRYRLVFSNEKDFTIGLNTILYKSSVSSLGRNSASGFNLTITEESERRLFRRCVANNAAYNYYERCSTDDMNIMPPPAGMCIWLFDDLSVSSCVMLHHGTLLSTETGNTYFNIAAWVVRLFGPDITIGTKGQETYREIYSSVVHELSHASHFSKVGLDYWNNYIKYVIASGIASLGAYGSEDKSGAGYCAVGEMWGYYMESKMYKERYGGSNPLFGGGNWFHPQILTYLDSRGLTTSQIFSAMEADVVDSQKFKAKLMDLYPEKKSTINQVFSRYE